MKLERSSEEGQGMSDPAEEEPLQTSGAGRGAGCCLGRSPCRVRSSRSTSAPVPKGVRSARAGAACGTRGCAERGPHTQPALSHFQ